MERLNDGFGFAMGKMAAEFAASLIPLGIFLAGVAALWAYVWWLGWSGKREKKKAKKAKELPRWIEHVHRDFDGDCMAVEYECPECHERYFDDGGPLYRYCPWCGEKRGGGGADGH